jgi:hypothetical protein
MTTVPTPAPTHQNIIQSIRKNKVEEHREKRVEEVGWKVVISAWCWQGGGGEVFPCRSQGMQSRGSVHCTHSALSSNDRNAL